MSEATDRPTRMSAGNADFEAGVILHISTEMGKFLAFTSLFFGVIVKLLNCKPLIFKNTDLLPTFPLWGKVFLRPP